MPVIAAVATAFPPHYYEQDRLFAALREQWRDQVFHMERLEQFHQRMQVGGRHLALPIEEYPRLRGFGAHNDAWIRVAVDLGSRVVADLLAGAGLPAGAVDQLVTTTVTGLAVPSLDARLMNRLPFRSDLKRVPLFGLGCLGGAAGLARAADYLRGHPSEACILLAVELCSLTLQKEDFSPANLLSSGLFGDGAAAVLLLGDEHPAARGPQVVASRSVFFPDTERTMGWDLTDGGFQVVLGPEVPSFARDHLPPAVHAFLGSHGLGVADIGAWIAHPGGPRVMDAMAEGLGLPTDALRLSRESLERVGNVSSASVLFVLAQALKEGPTGWGVVLAMGPAFCAELVLLAL